MCYFMTLFYNCVLVRCGLDAGDIGQTCEGDSCTARNSECVNGQCVCEQNTIFVGGECRMYTSQNLKWDLLLH